MLHLEIVSDRPGVAICPGVGAAAETCSGTASRTDTMQFEPRYLIVGASRSRGHLPRVMAL
jgi:azurin